MRRKDPEKKQESKNQISVSAKNAEYETQFLTNLQEGNYESALDIKTQQLAFLNDAIKNNKAIIAQHKRTTSKLVKFLNLDEHDSSEKRRKITPEELKQAKAELEDARTLLKEAQTQGHFESLSKMLNSSSSERSRSQSETKDEKAQSQAIFDKRIKDLKTSQNKYLDLVKNKISDNVISNLFQQINALEKNNEEMEGKEIELIKICKEKLQTAMENRFEQIRQLDLQIAYLEKIIDGKEGLKLPENMDLQQCQTMLNENIAQRSNLREKTQSLYLSNFDEKIKDALKSELKKVGKNLESNELKTLAGNLTVAKGTSELPRRIWEKIHYLQNDIINNHECTSKQKDMAKRQLAEAHALLNQVLKAEKKYDNANKESLSTSVMRVIKERLKRSSSDAKETKVEVTENSAPKMGEAKEEQPKYKR